MLPPRMLKPMLAARRPPSIHEGTSAAPFPAIKCPTIRFAARIVANSSAFTFAALGMVQEELDRGQIVPVLQAPWMRGEWNVARLRKRTMSPAMIAFVEEVQRAHSGVLREKALLSKRWFASPDASSPWKHATRRPEPRPRKATR